ncbi:MAG: amidohydrolase family protein [Ignavibacteriales bacterium]|nr:amidohydrolase family protein [Ignavibacteriales bacterium]
MFSDAEPEKFGPIFAKLFEIGCLIVSELAKYEVRMLVGQDGYIPRFTHSEMVLLSQNGLSAMDVLKGATRYPAEWLGIADKYGSIAAGKRANLVILDRNPVEDIRNVQSVHMVVRDGAIAF